MGDIFIREFNISAQQYSFLVSSYAFGAVLSSLLAFFYLDRFDRKSALLFLYVGFSIGTLICGLADSFSVLVMLRFATGAFGGVIGALAFAIVADLYRFKERGRAMGILMGAFSAASALGIPFGLYLAAAHTWRTPFLSLGVIALVVSILIFFFFPSIKEHINAEEGHSSFGQTIKTMVQDKNQLYALLLGMVLILGHFIIIPFISPYMIRNVGFSQMDVTLTFLFGGLAMVFTSPLIGKLTDVYGVFRVFTVFIFLSFIPTIAITHMAVQPVWYGLIFTTLFFVLASGRMIPANTLITASVGSANRGSFMSMKSALQQLSIGMASIISGSIVYLKDDGQYGNYNYLAYIAIFFCLLSIYICTKLQVAEGN